MAAPGGEPLAHEAGNGAPVLIDQLQPRYGTHLREIDSPEAHSRYENVDAIAQWLVLQGDDGLRHGLRAVRMSPSVFYFRVSFRDRHLQRSVGHLERYELLPVLRARQSPGGLQPFVKRRRGQRRQQTKNR